MCIMSIIQPDYKHIFIQYLFHISLGYIYCFFALSVYNIQNLLTCIHTYDVYFNGVDPGVFNIVHFFVPASVQFSLDLSQFGISHHSLAFLFSFG